MRPESSIDFVWVGYERYGEQKPAIFNAMPLQYRIGSFEVLLALIETWRFLYRFRQLLAEQPLAIVRSWQCRIDINKISYLGGNQDENNIYRRRLPVSYCMR